MMLFTSSPQACQQISNREASSGMLHSAQIRAARALLGWTQAELAKRAGVGLATLQRIEQSEGVARGIFSTVAKVQRTLENAGIRFIDSDSVEGIGVRLTRPEPDRGPRQTS